MTSSNEENLNTTMDDSSGPPSSAPPSIDVSSALSPQLPSADADAIGGRASPSSLAMPPPPKPSATSDSIRPSSSHSRFLDMSSSSDTPDDRTVKSPSASGDVDDSARSESTPTIAASQKQDMPASSSLPDAALASGMRPAEPDLEPNRMSFSSFMNYGAGIYTSVKQAYGTASGPSSITGNSEADGPQTSVHNISGTSSQSGALSPSLNGSISQQNLTPQRAYVPSPAPSSPGPHGVRGEGRTIRGRAPPNNGRVPSSGPGSASASQDRSSIADPPNFIGTIGICALDSKARSKPSRNILNRLVGKDGEFKVIIFGDKVILDENVENWPICDFLISFFSDGFPLEKAIAYAKLRKPFCVNDLPMQTVLWDRRMCLRILDQLEVPSPRRLAVNRDGGPVLLSTDIADRVESLTGLRLEGSDDGRGGGEEPPADVHMEDDNDTLVVDGQRLSKPFVEKPVSGEDHNINIYYPKSQGGGGRRLFRKINNKSSEKDETLCIPRAILEPDVSYIYEQFLKVENAEDVKAYTVGQNYVHAETRKSPVVDGVVKRNPNGKEIRYVTPLTEKETKMAAKIAKGFGQAVCGFDLLRVDKESFVIDVNGWSFVKDNNDYYDQSAKNLKEMFVKAKEAKARKEAKRSPSEQESDDAVMSLPSSSAPEAIGIQRKNTNPREKEPHRSTLKEVFRSRSISALRDSVSQAAGRGGNLSGQRSPSGATSPLTSPPSFERNMMPTARTPVPQPKDVVLPPPAVSKETDDSNTAVDEQDVMPEDIVEHQEEPQIPVPAPASKSQWKLKGMVAVIRHADRTPKQKFKFTFHTKPFVDLLKGHQEEVLLVGEAALQSVQNAVQVALSEGEEDMTKLRTLSNALQKKGHLAGTKVQIKPMFKKPKQLLAEAEAAAASEAEHSSAEKREKKLQKEKKLKDATGIEKPKRSDSISEVTMSRATAAEESLVLDKLQLVMKWGGEPTHSARYQATDLGENMRNDLLLMNSEVLNDVSIFTSSERRVMTSAHIFAAAFLDQKPISEDQIRVRKDLLDDSNAAKDEMDKVKKKLKSLLRKGHQAPEQFAWPRDGTPEPFLVVRNVVELMKFHRRVMHSNLAKLLSPDSSRTPGQIQNPSSLESSNESLNSVSTPQVAQASAIQTRWCTGEDAELFKERWEKLFNEFMDAERVDPSKISELYDTMKFDALHNRQFLEWVFTPSKAMIAELEGESHRNSTLHRTESQEARAEFSQTHEGVQPSSPPTAKDKIPSMAERIGLRRKSYDLQAVNRNVVASPALQHNPAQSYFNLFTGWDEADHPESKVKHDVRLEKLNELYSSSKILFDFIGPQEYGITDAEKLEIGLLTSLPLLKEIVKDIEEGKTWNPRRVVTWIKLILTSRSNSPSLRRCEVVHLLHQGIPHLHAPQLHP
jgi:inositol hexakisphosphate/diphosphoinositol-pentakisphosphate kinase